MITEKDITVFTNLNGVWTANVVRGTIREVSTRNRLESGITTSNTALARIFVNIPININDIVVNGVATDILTDAPLTELKERYGEKNAMLVKSVDNYFVGLTLDHIKLGLI